MERNDKMKKLMMALVLMPLMALATSTNENGYTWTYWQEDGAARIVGITPNPTGALTIPASLGGLSVKWLGCGPCMPTEPGFGLGNVTSFTLPPTLEYVWREDFDGYADESNAEWWRSQGDGLVILEEWAIGLKSDVSNLVLPLGVKKVACNFVCGMTGLQSVSFPDGLEIICESAFGGCVNLRNVHIPASVKTIGVGAFDDVPGPLYFHGKPPKVVDCGGGSISFDPFNDVVPDSDGGVVYFKRGVSGWTDGGTWMGLKTLAWDENDGTGTSGDEGCGDECSPTEEPQGDDCGGECSPTEDDGGGSGVNDPFDGNVKHVFVGLVRDKKMEPCGLIQVTTDKATAKGVKVSGFVMLEDGKKATMKAVTVAVEKNQLKVSTTVGKLGGISLTIDGKGFDGTLGDMKVATEKVGEDTGILKATVKMSYFDGGTGKLKSRSVKLTGITVDGAAAGTLTTKGRATKDFVAEIK